MVASWLGKFEQNPMVRFFKNVQNAIFRPMVIFRLTMVLQRRIGGQLIGKVWAKSNGSLLQKCAKCDSTFDRDFQGRSNTATADWWPADCQKFEQNPMVRFLKNVQNAIFRPMVIFRLTVVLQRRIGGQLIGKVWAKSNGSFPQKCAKCDSTFDRHFQAGSSRATPNWWPADCQSLSKIQWFVSSKTCKTRFNIRWWFSSWQQQSNAKLVASWLPKFEQNPMVRFLKNVQNAIFRPMVIFRLTVVLQRRIGGQLIGKVWAKSNGSFPQKCAKCDFPSDGDFQANNGIATADWWPADWESLSKIQWFVSSKMCKMRFNIRSSFSSWQQQSNAKLVASWLPKFEQNPMVRFLKTCKTRFNIRWWFSSWQQQSNAKLVASWLPKFEQNPMVRSFPQKCAKCDFPSDGDFQANSSIATADWWPADWESLSKIQWFVSSKMCKMRFSVRWWFSG